MQSRILTLSDISRIATPIVQKYRVPALYVFGSYARGTASENSDIDLLIDTDGTDLTSLFALGALYSELEDALGKPIDLITVSALTQTPAMPSERNFTNTVMKERVSLYHAA